MGSFGETRLTETYIGVEYVGDLRYNGSRGNRFALVWTFLNDDDGGDDDDDDDDEDDDEDEDEGGNGCCDSYDDG